MQYLLMAASSRKNSLNKKLIYSVEVALSNLKASSRKLDFLDYVPIGYCGDIEEKKGVPDIAKDFALMLKNAEKVIFSTPEYNYSIPGVFKNLIDWVSRIKPSPWQGKKILVLTASPSIQGGSRSYAHSLQIFHGLGAHLFPKTMHLSNAHTQFDKNDMLQDQKLQVQIEEIIKGFAEF